MTENDEFLRFTLPVSTARHKNQTSLKPLVTYTLVSLNLFPLEISSPPEWWHPRQKCSETLQFGWIIFKVSVYPSHLPVGILLLFLSLKTMENSIGKVRRLYTYAKNWIHQMRFYLSAQYECKSSGTKKPFTWKKYQLPRDFVGTPTWPPFYNCFGTSIWLPWCHVKTLTLQLGTITSPYLVELSFAFKNTSKTL